MGVIAWIVLGLGAGVLQHVTWKRCNSLCHVFGSARLPPAVTTVPPGMLAYPRPPRQPPPLPRAGRTRAGPAALGTAYRAGGGQPAVAAARRAVTGSDDSHRWIAISYCPSPERLAPGTGPDRGAVQQPAAARPRPGRTILRTALSAAIVAAIFGFALPRFASYRSVLSSMAAMTWPQALLVGIAAAASMASAWIMICSVLPSIRLREAAVVNLGSNAVANTLPAGGALAMGVSWAMLSSWGISTAEYVLYTLVSGIWNVFARLGLPVLALLVLVTASRPGAGLIAAAVVGLALLAAATAGFGLLLRSESFALRAGRALQRVLAVACRLARRQAASDVAGSLPASAAGPAP